MGDELVVVIATDNTVRRRKHEPITPEKMRLELVSSLKPVDRAVLGQEGDMFQVVAEVEPDIIALGYDQMFDERELEQELLKRGMHIRVVRLGHYEDDLDGTRKIIRRIIDWHKERSNGPEERP